MKQIQELNSYLVIRRRGRILLLKRHNGIWEFPGGGVEFGEHPKDAAIREAKEETGLSAKDAKPIGLTSATFPSKGKKKHAVYAVYSATGIKGSVSLSGEHIDFAWFTSTEAKKLKLGLNVKPVLKML